MEFEVHTGDPGTIGTTQRHSGDGVRYELLSGGVLLVVDDEGRRSYYAASQWSFLHDPPRPSRYR